MIKICFCAVSRQESAAVGTWPHKAERMHLQLHLQMLDSDRNSDSETRMAASF